MLKDESVCALSVSCRQRENSIPARYRCDRNDHVCCIEGRGIALYGFCLKVQGHELQVWEKCSQELLGLSGLEFARAMPHWWQKKELFQFVIKAD